MLAGDAGQSNNSVGCDTDEATRLSDAVALGQMLEDGDGGGFREPATIQRRPLAFREAGATGVAREESELLVLTVVAADGEVAGIPSAVERAVRVLAAETGEIFHGTSGPGGPGLETTRG